MFFLLINLGKQSKIDHHLFVLSNKIQIHNPMTLLYEFHLFIFNYLIHLSFYQVTAYKENTQFPQSKPMRKQGFDFLIIIFWA